MIASPLESPMERIKPARYMRLTHVLVLMERMGIDVNMRTLQRWCATGKMPARKFGGDWRLDMERLKLARSDEDHGGPGLYEELVLAINREVS